MTIEFKPLASLREIKKRKKDAVDRTFKEWENRGFPTFSQPDSDYPQLPENLTDLPNAEIERRIVVFRLWDSYVSEQYVDARLLYDFRVDLLKSVEAKLIDELSGTVGDSLEKRRSAVRADSDYMAAQEDMRRGKFICDKLEAHHKQLSRDYSALSRIIEIRRLEQGGRFARDNAWSDVEEEDRYVSD